MAAVHPFLPLLLLLLLCSTLLSARDAAPMSDAAALLLLKDSFINTTALSTWSPSSATSPCDPREPWTGVVCFGGILTGLRLAGIGLGGTVDIDALAHFRGLRSISLDNNSLHGPIPAFGRLPALKSIYLSRNNFSGPIPDNFFSRMTHLKKIWLSGNAFAGPIPSSLSSAKSLMELHLEGNHFSGPIPALALPSLKSFDVSYNELEGPVPASIARFDARSFQGNPGLCGTQGGGEPCEGTQVPHAADAVVPPTAVETKPEGAVRKGKLTIVSVMLLVVVLTLLVAAVLITRKRKRDREFDTLGMGSNESTAEAIESAEMKPYERSSHKFKQKQQQLQNESGQHMRTGSSSSAELVVVNDEKGQFALTDLMKAAAEVLGNGGLGSAYKAVMASGVAVVVKRLREMNRVTKEAFDMEMRRLGRLRHPNVLPLLAYHYRKDEKLIVTEYVPKGSLLYLLHGDQGLEHAALDASTRIKIVRGIAKGMVYLHTELASLDVPHGNLKSGNILLGPNFEPLLVDYGLMTLVNPSAASQALFAYKSPESLQYRHVSPKSDVYCFGIVILEILTGKFPSQYLNNTKGGTDVAQWAASAMAEHREAELLDPEIALNTTLAPVIEQFLRLGAACAEPNPDLRPDMREAATRIEEIATSAGLDEGSSVGGASSFIRSISRSSSAGEHSRRNSGDEERS